MIKETDPKPVAHLGAPCTIQNVRFSQATVRCENSIRIETIARHQRHV
uniref:Uncharacterized protein n=1 Tax=Anguilla anguilla TaxID=7936 RepID=A0A0E9RT90_ANGAN